MTADNLLRELRSLANQRNVAGMARFGINPHRALGVPVGMLRRIARCIGKNHALALALWKSGIHEARILAGIIDEPAKVTSRQMDAWACDFDSWDVCDQCCNNLFDKTPFAYRKAATWSRRREEFVKRAGFALMAALAVHDKKASDATFVKFLLLIEHAASDDRNFVKKAVNWALRQIGKRNARLRRLAIASARRIRRQDSRPARWIAADALRELQPRLTSR
jgi:3-methyladenine DNA glycosylase AlkD